MRFRQFMYVLMSPTGPQGVQAPVELYNLCAVIH